MQGDTIWILSVIFGLLVSFAAQANDKDKLQTPVNASRYFKITVVDRDTGRGIPLVELRTENEILFYTDSAGKVAFWEPVLMNRAVFFHAKSHGYEIAEDGMGCAGCCLEVKPGENATIEMKRINIAQRLYRITGMGIYHDSVLLGDEVPIEYPLSNASVVGQDSTLACVYKGDLFWVWGDTGHPRHPLGGNFHVTCATSTLPEKGGLDPEVGVNLNYLTEGGFVKKMAHLWEGGPVWLGGLLSIEDEKGKQHLVANHALIKPPMETAGRGMVEFNEEKQVFEQILSVSMDAVIRPEGHPFRTVADDSEWIYFPGNRWCRVKSDYASVIDWNNYEAFTCLKEGGRIGSPEVQLDREDNGVLKYGWKKNTCPIGHQEQQTLLADKKIQPEERWVRFVDVNSGDEVLHHAGSVYWNEYRKRWVRIYSQSFGSPSFLGEVWYCEGDTPLGPWGYTIKIVTHEDYSFYNPVQHPYFAKEDGRLIFFEGTYTKGFSGTKTGTPRYNYNQIMYSIELDDPRLFLPVPVYQTGNESARYLTHNAIENDVRDGKIAFFAPDRPKEGTMPIYESWSPESQAWLLSSTSVASTEKSDERIAFYAIDRATDSPPPCTTPLYEFVDPSSRKRLYSIHESLCSEQYKRTKRPVCLVWEKPTEFNPLDVE